MTVRRRLGEGTVHPVVLKGRVVSHRGLASYKDPVTGKQRRRSVSRKTREEAERALAALLRTLPKAKPVRRHTATPPALPPAREPDSVHAFLMRWLAYKERECGPPRTARMFTPCSRCSPPSERFPSPGFRCLRSRRWCRPCTDRTVPVEPDGRCTSCGWRCGRRCAGSSYLLMWRRTCANRR